MWIEVLLEIKRTAIKLRGLLLLALLFLVFGVWLMPTFDRSLLANILLNISSGAFTAFVIVVVIDLRNNVQEEIDQLVWDLGSNIGSIAQRAAFDIKRKGWLDKGVLCNLDIQEANLEGANFSNADFSNTILGGANLCNVDFSDANLNGVHFKFANLTGADLTGASMKRVKLAFAIMPDGQKASGEIDIERFTNYRHPNYWRSDDPESPAFEST